MSIIEKTEEQQRNDLFYLCSLIEYIGRQTKNERGKVVELLGDSDLIRIYNLADVYHCENMAKVAFELEQKHGITEGTYDNMTNLPEHVPTHWDIGKVYDRLIRQVAKERGLNVVETLKQVYSSWISRKIDNYQSAMYYSSPSYLFESFNHGTPL